MRRQLPIFDERCLDNVGIANPCDASWEQMKGDDRVRHCPSCRLNVYNISAMTRREAAALIGVREGRLCLKMLKRSDDTLITQDCRDRLRQARKRGLVAFAVALTIVCITQFGIRVLGVRALLSWHRAETTTTRMLGEMEMAPMGVMVAPDPKHQPLPAPKLEAPMVGQAVFRPAPTDAKALKPHGAPSKPKPEKPTHMKMGKIIAPSTFMGDIDIK